MANGFQKFTNRLLDPGVLNDDTVRQNQQMADMLLNQSSQPRPIGHFTQGLAQLANAMNAQILRQRGERGQKALETQRAQQMGDLLNNLSLDPQQTQVLQSLPPEVQQQVLPQLAMGQFQPPEQFTLRPGDQRVDSRGNLIASAPPKPNETTRQFREGGEFVTRRVVDGLPDMSDTGVLSRSPIDRVQRVEQGEPGAFDPRTRSQQGQDVQNFQNAVIGGVKAINTASELLAIAQQTPDAIGTPGNLFRVGNEMVRTAEALGRFAGFDPGINRNLDGFTFDGFDGKMRSLAIENEAFRSGVFGIAFAAAVAEQGTRPTDKDIQAFIDQIAGSSSDPRAFARTIKTFIGRSERSLRTTANVKDIPDDVRQRAFAELDQSLQGFNAFFAEPQELPGFDELTPAEQAELKRLMEAQGVNNR